ncbi:sensor histidine kinase [Staphylococcus epidermidis]|uniref:sensor histidine kinase n=1 Tax=Staphylococcus epidermidis TaxID=1282 RepID=UPI0011A9B298|nr:HAMP domain-containing sensor histidine kinase [Staphylococcus epidermidis]
MARVESLKRKMTRLIIAIIVVSVGLVFLLQILLNVLEFSNFGKSLYTNFWKQPHYIFSFTSACISIMTPLLIIYVFTQFFYKKYITTSINYLNDTIQGLKNNRTDVEYKKMNITEFNKLIQEVEHIHTYLANSIKDQLSIQNNFKRKLEILEHDLKTPLTVLQGHIELLRKINRSNLSQEEIQFKINKEADIALQSIDRINNQLQIHIKNINLLPNHSDTIHVDHDFSYHTLSINNQVLYHVIDNLINNALKYAEKQISIKFEIINEHLLNFTITNDGRIFTEDELNSAKEWGTKGKESNGSGIGLYFANIVLQQYNSELILENENKHAKVSFNIPV